MTAETFADNEDAEYLDIFWGILRHPIACVICGRLTRTPTYHNAEAPTGPTCIPCFRAALGL